jgi:hypothetical protein
LTASMLRIYSQETKAKNTQVAYYLLRARDSYVLKQALACRGAPGHRTFFSNLASCATATCVCDCMYTSSPPKHTHTHTHIPHPPTQRFVRNHMSILSGLNCVAFECPFCVRVPLVRGAGVKYINWTGLKEVFLYI